MTTPHPARLASLFAALSLAAFALAVAPTSSAEPPPPPPPPPFSDPPAPGPGPAPAPSPSPAPSSDEYAIGERCVDEAARWIAKGETPPTRLENMHADLDYVYDDGSNHDERRMELWFRNPDAFRANFEYAGRPSQFLLVGERGFMIRDAIRVTDLNNSPTMKVVLPQLKDYRDILREVGRLMAPSGLKGPGVSFRFLGNVADPRATGGQWFKVLRKAPGEGDMTFFFGSAPRKDGPGLRAIAPDKIIMGGPPGSNYAGDEYALEGWVHESAAARSERFRYPAKIKLFAIGIDKPDHPTLRANVNFLEINTQLDPALFTPPY